MDITIQLKNALGQTSWLISSNNNFTNSINFNAALTLDLQELCNWVKADIFQWNLPKRNIGISSSGLKFTFILKYLC